MTFLSITSDNVGLSIASDLIEREKSMFAVLEIKIHHVNRNQMSARITPNGKIEDFFFFHNGESKLAMAV